MPLPLMLGLAHIGQADPGRGNSPKEIGEQSAMLAGFLGAWKDALATSKAAPGDITMCTTRGRNSVVAKAWGVPWKKGEMRPSVGSMKYVFLSIGRAVRFGVYSSP